MTDMATRFLQMVHDGRMDKMTAAQLLDVVWTVSGKREYIVRF